MTFSEYDIVKSQYTLTEQFEDLRLYLCADRRCTDRVWQAPLSKQIEIQEQKIVKMNNKLEKMEDDFK